jgi:preprotein translocase subunit SecD
VGGKLATVFDGRVRSAPIINGRIAGGQASIAMGAGDAEHEEREAQDLIAVVRTSLVPPLTLATKEVVPPVPKRIPWLVVAPGFAAFAGLAAMALRKRRG